MIKKTVIAGTRSRLLDQARLRLLTVVICFTAGFLIVGLRLVDLTLIGQSTPSVVLAHKPSKASFVRANIFDRTGEVLATSLQTDSLYADPKYINDPKSVAQELVATFPDLNYGDTLQKLQSQKRFVWIKRNLTPNQKYLVNALGRPGLNFKTEWRRFYPQTHLFSHVTGYTDIDGNGIAGIEKSFNQLLEEGQDVTLSLDTRIQHIARRELNQAIKKFKAKGGSALVMDINNGDILAMTSLPDFDPHHADEASTDERFNRNTLGVFEMGSTFKIFSTALALDSGVSKIYSTFDARKPIKVGRFQIRDYHAQKRVMTLPEVFIHSSNIGSAMMAEKAGTEKVQDFYRDLGLFNAPSLEIPEIGTPLIPTPWREINTLTTSYGHGIAVSPLQTVKAAAAILNGGTLPTPTLIKTEHNPDRPRVQIISPRTSAYMRQLMELVVTDGTASKAHVTGYRVGGKTGTAEKISPHGGYDKDMLLSSFLGVFPADEPEYIVLVTIDEPKGTKDTFGYATGGWTATPVAGKIIENTAPLLGLMAKDQDKDIAHNPLRKYLKDKKRSAHLASF